MENMQKNIPSSLISVGLPVYNDEKYISAAIEDILGQSYQKLEIIISDNCSTDGTELICRKFAARDPRIKYIRQKANIGPHANFKFVLDCSRGKYFMWAGSDDRWDLEFIARLAQALESNPMTAVAFCPYIEIDESGESLPKTYTFDFGGTSTLQRITKFNLETSDRRDAFFYGLFNRSRVTDLKIVKWWWINQNIAMNNAYPPLSYTLAAGNYHLENTDRPLWFKRVHLNSKPRHSADFASRHILSYLAFHLRKINQLYETEKSVIRGSGSIWVGVLVFPILAARCLYDCIVEARRVLVGVVRRLRRMWQRA